MKREGTWTIQKALTARLRAKGLGHFEIERIVRDVSLIIEDKKEVSFDMVIRKLELLGWERPIVDRISFEQILFLKDEACLIGSEGVLNLQFSPSLQREVC